MEQLLSLKLKAVGVQKQTHRSFKNIEGPRTLFCFFLLRFFFSMNSIAKSTPIEAFITKVELHNQLGGLK